MRSWRQQFAAAAAAVVLSACGHVIPGKLTGDGHDFDFAKPCTAAAAEPQPIEVRYLGAGNMYVRWRDEAILLGPSFSRPNAFRAKFGKLFHDEPRITKALDELPNIRAVLAGHSHYDHLGDLPVVAERIPRASIYLNEHGRYMLAPYGLDKRVRPLVAGEPIVEGSFRIIPLTSSHAQQFCGWNLRLCRYADGPIAANWDAKWPERRFQAMRGGDTFAFAIELLGAKPEPYRIFYNDSSGVPKLDGVTGPFDLAILTAAQWERVDGYPRVVLEALRPRHVVVSHWENFFTTTKTQFVFRLHPRGFIETANRLATGGGKPVNDVCGAKNDNWTMPMPGASMLFTPTPRKAP